MEAHVFVVTLALNTFLCYGPAQTGHNRTPAMKECLHNSVDDNSSLVSFLYCKLNKAMFQPQALQENSDLVLAFKCSLVDMIAN